MRLATVIRQLHQSCRTAGGGEDLKKGTQLLEVYALEIQMCTEQKNSKRLKTLYEQSLRIKSAIPHPLIMGIVRGVVMAVGGAMWVGPWWVGLEPKRCWLMCMTPCSCRVWGEDAPAGRRVLSSTHGLL